MIFDIAHFSLIYDMLVAAIGTGENQRFSLRGPHRPKQHLRNSINSSRIDIPDDKDLPSLIIIVIKKYKKFGWAPVGNAFFFVDGNNNINARSR